MARVVFQTKSSGEVDSGDVRIDRGSDRSGSIDETTTFLKMFFTL